MNITTVGAGVFALLYGLSTIYFRLKAPEKFGKLGAMKQAYGPLVGSSLHILSYTLVPLVVGISLILSGLRGAPLLGP